MDPFLEKSDRRFDALGNKLDYQFRWLAGLLILTGIVAVTGILWGP